MNLVSHDEATLRFDGFYLHQPQRSSCPGYQGFPILKNGRLIGENEIKSLIEMGIKEAHLTSDIANAKTIHEAQDIAIELSKQVGNGASTSLAVVLQE
ncbi:hypothetical protein [Ktedonobacter sp. SOSP1-52]|uniref:hypothetical protein n=1 Tax=Ktedonobacter sp. SOSP1-52 TaxID=2778366 RepID=UPI001915DF29|nr:hypothetical protein [Ktedonobacter sp. SOSP1-52]